MNTASIFYHSVPRRKFPYLSEYPICVRYMYNMQLFSLLDCKGIYFLFNDTDTEPIYVGKAVKVGNRVRQHYSGGHGKQFQYFTFVNLSEWEDNDIKNLERDLIRKIKPKMNIQVL